AVVAHLQGSIAATAPRGRNTEVRDPRWDHTFACQGGYDLSVSNWQTVTHVPVGWAALVARQAQRLESLDGDAFPALRDSPQVLVFSDFGAYPKGARPDVLSFLITNDAHWRSWNVLRARWRADNLRDQRRM